MFATQAPDRNVRLWLKRRPRLTNAEAVILNALQNADGRPLTVARLAGMANCVPQSVYKHICMLRAKLGEVRWKPAIIVSCYVGSELDDEYRTMAYRYIEPGE